MTDPASEFAAQVQQFGSRYDAIVAELRRVIVGHEAVIEEVMAALLAGGHALLEGVPGLGKTLLVRTLADALEASFGRIQFTPDLMPADITGTNVVVADPAGGKQFRFEPGPLFANILLADEINRATPKTQSAVLEAMQERTVSVARTTHRLPEPFLVLATQNPLEMEGTYPLPEAQVDRFLLKVLVTMPDEDELAGILDRTTGAETPRARRVVDAAAVRDMQALVRRVPAARHVQAYIARVVLATHPDNPAAPQAVRTYVRHGASPRGGQALLLAGKVRALRQGRANVAFEDVRAVAAAALRHRLILSFEGQADGAEPDDLVAAAVAAVAEPASV